MDENPIPCANCFEINRLYWCDNCIKGWLTIHREKSMKDQERRLKQYIAKVVRHECDLPEYFREQAGYYRRKRLQRDLTLAADVIQQLQLELKEARDATA